MTFTVLRQLGRGAAGEVFLVRDEDGRLLALKRPLPGAPDALATFEREKKFASALSHPNIVSLVDSGSDAQGPYLVLEYVDGASLAELEDVAKSLNRPIPSEAVSVLALGVARALEAAHATTVAGHTGVVHRDVSTDNVLVSRDGEIKLSDFGIARSTSGTAGSSSGLLRGRLSTFAPELLDGAAPTPASDVFALGALIFRLIAGTDPFIGKNDAEVLRSLRHGRAPSLTTFQTACPLALIQWVDAALTKEPGTRPTVAALVTALESESALLATGRQQWRGMVELGGAHSPHDGSPSGPWTASVGQTATSPVRRHWPLIALVVAALALIILVQWLNPVSHALEEEPDADAGVAAHE